MEKMQNAGLIGAGTHCRGNLGEDLSHLRGDGAEARGDVG